MSARRWAWCWAAFPAGPGRSGRLAHPRRTRTPLRPGRARPRPRWLASRPSSYGARHRLHVDCARLALRDPLAVDGGVRPEHEARCLRARGCALGVAHQSAARGHSKCCASSPADGRLSRATRATTSCAPSPLPTSTSISVRCGEDCDAGHDCLRRRQTGLRIPAAAFPVRQADRGSPGADEPRLRDLVADSAMPSRGRHRRIGTSRPRPLRASAQSRPIPRLVAVAGSGTPFASTPAEGGVVNDDGRIAVRWRPKGSRCDRRRRPSSG